MSKECIRNCPKIERCIRDFPEDQHPSISTGAILRACEASYECPGPIQKDDLEVVTGFFRKQTITVPQYDCGLTTVIAETAPNVTDELA